MQNFMQQFVGIELTTPQTILFFLVIIWTLFWKGLALWHSVKRGDKKWFIAILILNSFGIIELIYLFFVIKIKSIKLD